MIAVTALLTLAAYAIHLDPVNADRQARHKPDDPPRACRDARKAIVWYRARYNEHRAVMGASLAPALERHMGCRRVRERAAFWVSAASSNRAAAVAWVAREYAAPPEPFLSIARCEQHSDHGLHGVNWHAYSESYEGAYGFLHSTWDDYKPVGYPDNANQATPRQQTEVAKILVRTFGGYSSWPACHIRLGLPG